MDYSGKAMEDAGLEGAGSLLREVTRLHARAQRLKASCIGCTLTECHVLTELGRAGPLPLTELGKRLGLHKGWVSRTVASMIESGYLSRRPAGDDGRAIVISLTKSGSSRYRDLDRALNSEAAAIIGRIPAANLKGIRASLESMRDALLETLERA